MGTGPSVPLSLSPAGSAGVGLLPALAAVGLLSLPPDVTSRTAATARAPSATTAMTRLPGAERGGVAAGGGSAGAGAGAPGCAEACVDAAKGGIEAPDGGAD